MLLCCACGKDKAEEEQRKTLQEAASTYYGIKGTVAAYSLDEEGNMYIASRLSESGGYGLYQYDAGQNLQRYYGIDISVEQMDSLAAGEEAVYFISANEKGKKGVRLYSVDKEFKQQEILAEYSFFDTVRQMFFQDGRLYLLGSKTANTGVSSGSGYSFHDDRLIYYSLEEKESYVIEIDRPVHMACLDNGKVMVYAYLDSGKYGILEYDPVEDVLNTKAQFDSYNIQYFAACNEGQDILYSYSVNSRGIVMSSLEDFGNKTELCPQKLIAKNPQLSCKNGQVCFINYNGDVMSFALADVYRNSKSIRYISPGYQVDEPYGCGYRMKRQEMEEDKFVLKVLAQDRDYDLCLIDSINGSSYNLRKNGVFYPLNDVRGIEEYFEKCFPYVKEAATKEDGTIWMLPIAVYMPGLIVQEDTLKEMKVPLKRNMTWEEFTPVIAGMTEEQASLKSLSQIVCTMLFFQQYFKHYNSVDTEVFRKNAAALQLLDSDMLLSDMREDKRYLFYYARYMYSYTNSVIREVYYGPNAKVYPMPKLAAEDANTGTCIFLAVNPASDRLEDTLAFLEDWMAWQMMEEDVPLYFKDSKPEEGTFEADIYALYQNGEIAFAIDEDTYNDDFSEMLEGAKSIEEYIRGTEQKLKIYFGE